MNLSNTDIIVFGLYVSTIIFLGIWVSRKKKGETRDAKDYFLAGKSLTWWAIGASLIAANISAEQMIGMSGSGYAVGLGIASYEWMAAITLILVGKFFLPIFIKKEIYTMPQFLINRYNNRVRTILAVFWISVYVFVNLTSVLYLGALALRTIMGIPLIYGVLILALIAAAYSIYGGLSAVAWTDILQVILLIFGGLVTTIIALNVVSDGEGVIAGFKTIMAEAPERFHMIIKKGTIILPDGSGGTKDAYMDLPGLGVLIGGLWVANLYYWGFNQYIIQRALGAKSLKEAQRGVVFAGFLKILIPIIVVLPGIAAYVMTNNPETMSRLGDAATVNLPSLTQTDKAYPWLLNLLPVGIKGLSFAALTAAIVSSLASMLNSTSTIFTMDIYSQLNKKQISESKKVTIGRITAFTALIIAIFIAPTLKNLDQAFQYIQEYTGMVSPGILAIFLLGLFWKKATAKSAEWAAILTIPVAFFFKIPNIEVIYSKLESLNLAFLFPKLPWMDQMGLSFLIIMGIMVLISLFNLKKKNKDADEKGIKYSLRIFDTNIDFNVASIIIMIIVGSLYIVFW